MIFAAIMADQRIPFDDTVAMEEFVFVLHIPFTHGRKIREEKDTDTGKRNETFVLQDESVIGTMVGDQIVTVDVLIDL